MIVLCAVPMLVIANAYRRLNPQNANCGASFEWVGRATNPYLGFLTGWLMIAAYITGAVTGVVVLALSVLAVVGASTTSTGANIAISTAVLAVMLVIAVADIKLTVRTQVTMAIAEYTILVGFAVAGLAWVLGRHPGTVPVTRGWFSLTGVGGKGDLAARAGRLGVHLLRLGRHLLRQRGGQAQTGQPRPGRRHRRRHPHHLGSMIILLLC